MTPPNPDKIWSFTGPSWIKALQPERVEEAPDGPGLYAWYAIPPYGRRNWDYEIGPDGLDLGIDRFRKAISRHVQRHAPPPLAVLVEGAFSARWTGTLKDSSGIDSEIEAASEPTDDPSEVDDYVAKRVKALTDTLDAFSLREKLVSVLLAATPFLTSPLYVGVAKILRQRLARHVLDLRRFHEKAGNDSKYREELATADKQNFASRAVARGFDPDSLIVFTCDFRELLGTGLGQDEQLRLIAEAAEWLLNRWHRPSLGRL